MNVLLVITIASLILAVVMSGVAWHSVGQERRRSDARVRALAAEINPESDSPDLDIRLAAPSDLFVALSPAQPRAPNRAAAIVTGIFVVASAAALAIVLSAGSRPGSSAGLRSETPSRLVPTAAIAQ